MDSTVAGEGERSAITFMTTTEDDRTDRWMGVARWGAVTMAVWSVGLQLVAGSIIPPVAVIGVVFAGFVPFLRGQRPRLGLTLAVLTLLMVVADALVIIDDAPHPESAPAFIFNLLSLTGAAVSMIGGVAAFRRMGIDRIGAVARVAPAVFSVGAFLSILVAANTTSESAMPGDVRLVASGASWSVHTVTAGAGGALWVDDTDGIRQVSQWSRRASSVRSRR